MGVNVDVNGDGDVLDLENAEHVAVAVADNLAVHDDVNVNVNVDVDVVRYRCHQ